MSAIVPGITHPCPVVVGHSVETREPIKCGWPTLLGRQSCIVCNLTQGVRKKSDEHEERREEAERNIKERARLASS